ncbi:MAG: glycine dehydrogenase (aminomethyl-transferring) [Chlamydiales bacterium 38-26]|nr:aminomethyl-transferring glycine dehydrogenase subunit GcvPB [Chlamydiales bacterium]OJV11494.1 MAG: glycine dehydrogenase (aminomethyl-transferring) [Chlamydiales bacterium 38-26]
MTRTVFEKSQPEQHAYSLTKDSTEFQRFKPDSHLLRQEGLPLPEISEIDLTRHFNELADRNRGIDNIFYPLGSCTMKFNPRINEVCANLSGFTKTHPLAPLETVQGNLQIIYELIEMLCEVTGMKAGSLLPNAGSQGEFTGLALIVAYHKERGDDLRNEMLIPDNAHGTNPASASMAGLKTIPIRTNSAGDLDLEHLKSMVSNRTCGLMLTNPNTLGLFSPHILDIAEIVHASGGLLYYDGANLNPILNLVRPGEMGFDVMHLNLHKTFSTPHGGGGPGSGPVLCNERLKRFLPVPRVEKNDNHYKVVQQDSQSIGRISSFYGNFLIYLRAYMYAKLHGHYGLRKIAEQAVINANYLKVQIGDFLTIPYPQPCMHEFVVQADRFLAQGIKAFDLAKRMLDYGVHAPTVYFPLIVKECMLVEPTESESKATLDQFIEIFKKILDEVQNNPSLIKTAPHTTPVSRLDEVLANKKPIFKHVIS